MLENISSRKLEASDWLILKDARLKSLQEMPSIYITTYADESRLDDAEWKSRLSSESGAIFGVFDGDNLIGITGAFRWLKSPEDTVLFGMSYLNPAYRGKGLSKMLYSPRFAWARTQKGVNRVIVGHREGNEASRAAILKWGFRPYAQEEITFGDGSKAIDIRYELRFT